MKQAQHVRERKSRTPACCLAAGIFAVENRFARLDVPVAIFAPEKTVQRLGSLVELIFVERGSDLANCPVELQQDPLVVRVSSEASISACTSPPCIGETAGVPELVAKVAAEFDIFFVRARPGREARWHCPDGGHRAILRDEFDGSGELPGSCYLRLFVADNTREVHVAEGQLSMNS